jgi:glycosyl transferase, family 25
MQIVVINLARSHERRARMSDALKRAGLSFSVFQAVDAHDHDRLQQVSKYSYKQALWSRRRLLKTTEVACFASHFLLWKACAAGNTPYLIMEDDVDLEPLFAQATEVAARHIQQYKMLRLAALIEDHPFVEVASHPPFRIVRFRKGPTGAQCYALSPEGAAMLVQGATTWIDAVDAYLDKF